MLEEHSPVQAPVTIRERNRLAQERYRRRQRDRVEQCEQYAKELEAEKAGLEAKRAAFEAEV